MLVGTAAEVFYNAFWGGGVFKGPYHSNCRVFNFLLPTVGCWIFEAFAWYTLKIVYFSSKQTDLSSIQDNLAWNPTFLTDNQYDSGTTMVLIWNM